MIRRGCKEFIQGEEGFKWMNFKWLGATWTFHKIPCRIISECGYALRKLPLFPWFSASFPEVYAFLCVLGKPVVDVASSSIEMVSQEQKPERKLLVVCCHAIQWQQMPERNSTEGGKGSMRAQTEILEFFSFA